MHEPPDHSRAQTPHWAERLVRILDDGFKVPGTNFGVGIDAIIGMLVPGAGDVVTAAGALGLFWAAIKQGVPRVVIARMAVNVAIDVLVGAVPLLGDLFDLVWKANRKNLTLIEAHRDRAAVRHKPSKGDYLVVAGAAFMVLSALGVTLWLLSLGVGWLWGLVRGD
jgi:hypothetical protein